MVPRRLQTIFNISNSGVVDVKQDATLSGTISGAGTINVNADTTMSGTMTAFTGTTNVASGETLTGNAGAGTLNLNDSATYDLGGVDRTVGKLNGASASSVLLGSNDLAINNGGTYAGTIGGTGDINVSGGDFALAEGAKVTTTGTTTIASGATLEVTAATNKADAAFQGGSLVNNGTLKTHFSTYSIPAGDNIDVYLGDGLNYSGSGTEVTVTNRLYKVIGGLSYDGSSLSYTLERNFASELFSQLTPTIGPVIDSYIGGNDLIEHLLNNSASDAELEKHVQSAFDFANQGQMGSALHGTWQGINQAIYNRSRIIPNDNLPRTATYRGQSCTSLQNELWITPIYGNNRGFGLNSGGFRSGFDYDQWGIGFGIERFCQKTRFGIMGIVGGGRMVTNGELAKSWNNTDFGGVHVYVNRKIHDMDLLFSTGWVGQGNSLRQAQLGGDLTGKMNSGLFSISTRLTKTICLNRTHVMPFIGIEYGRYYQNRMNANWGGQTAFVNDKADADMVVLPVGVHTKTDYFANNGGKWSPTFRAQYIANLADVGTGYNVHMTGSPASALMTTHFADRHAGEVGTGLGWTRGQITIAGDYSFMFSQHYQTQTASLTGTYRF